jgi:hypothetical protein
MRTKIPAGGTHTGCPVCGHKFRRPLTDAEYRGDIRIHELTSEKHKRKVASN